MTPLFIDVDLLLPRPAERVSVYDSNQPDDDPGRVGLAGAVGLAPILGGSWFVGMSVDHAWQALAPVWDRTVTATQLGLDAGLRWDSCMDGEQHGTCLWLDVAGGPRGELARMPAFGADMFGGLGARVGVGMSLGGTTNVRVGADAFSTLGFGGLVGAMNTPDGQLRWRYDAGSMGVMLRFGIEFGRQ